MGGGIRRVYVVDKMVILHLYSGNDCVINAMERQARTMNTYIPITIIILAIFTTDAISGQLSRFENAATKCDATATTSKTNWRERDRSCLNTLFSDLAGSCIDIVFADLIREAAVVTTERMVLRPRPSANANDLSRYVGDPGLPLCRADVHYQHVSSRVGGLDGRIEAGYGSLGLQIRHTRYEERRPDDSLGLTGIHGLFRVSWTERLELGLGLGGVLLDGESASSGISVTCPVNWYPHPRLNLRFAPVFSQISGNAIRDYDLSVGYIRQYFSLRSGYRWIRAGSETIDGPYAGISVHY